TVDTHKKTVPDNLLFHPAKPGFCGSLMGSLEARQRHPRLQLAFRTSGSSPRLDREAADAISSNAPPGQRTPVRPVSRIESARTGRPGPELTRCRRPAPPTATTLAGRTI